MNFEDLIERAGQRQRGEDNSGLDDENSKMGEGANTAVHLSQRGYVLKPVNYKKAQANNPCKAVEDPKDHVERVRDIDRFPWANIEILDDNESSDSARVRMESWYMSHEEAVDSYHISDIINEDLDMFFEIREEGVTYDDFKPDNIGYFQDKDISNQSMPVAKAIDITDGSSKPWSEEQDLSYRRFSDIMDVYIRGTPNEDGLKDLYAVSVPEAEEHVMNYLGLETTNITGDPYKDFFQVLDENQDRLEGVLSY